MDLFSGDLHFAAAVCEYILIFLMQPGNNIVKHLRTYMGDLTVVDMETDGTLLTVDDLVSNTGIIWVHDKLIHF
jgi:hypothetical protein